MEVFIDDKLGTFAKVHPLSVVFQTIEYSTTVQIGITTCGFFFCTSDIINLYTLAIVGWDSFAILIYSEGTLHSNTIIFFSFEFVTTFCLPHYK